ncbi:MAG: hypothetical protein JL50_17820 [Peptococcaceae bacterium BICA1-7]|nr:MAG: hypothetical protein JL50_17820 [Peptococcaceae bacterium BICA1-7]HBV98592.1 hypothetical protein [Desulfotomaculum sp.]
MGNTVPDTNNGEMTSKYAELIQLKDFKELAEAMPRCDRCGLDLPVGRTVGLDDQARVWAVGYNSALREIFRSIFKTGENGAVKKFYNKERYHDIFLDDAFFERLHGVSQTLLQTKTPMVNEYGILEDYNYDYCDRIDKLFKKIPGCGLRVGRGIALTDLVKCFSFNQSRRRKDDKSKLAMEECASNCIPYLLAEIYFKKPRLILFTSFGAYDYFVKKVPEFNFGQIKSHSSKKSNISILRGEGFSCYLIRGTTGDRWKSSGLKDYEKNKQDMIDALSMALKSIEQSGT